MTDLLVKQRRATEILKSVRAANETYKRAKESALKIEHSPREAQRETVRILEYKMREER